MSTFRQMSAADKVVVFIALIVGVFLLTSLGMVFYLTLADRTVDQVWERTFGLVEVLAGGVIGYLAGGAVARTKN